MDLISFVVQGQPRLALGHYIPLLQTGLRRFSPHDFEVMCEKAFLSYWIYALGTLNYILMDNRSQIMSQI